MIDYYYEFDEGTSLFDQPTRYAMLRGFHPDEATDRERAIHEVSYQTARRIWVENANGMTLLMENGRYVHHRCNPREITWLKLQARELNES